MGRQGETIGSAAKQQCSRRQSSVSQKTVRVRKQEDWGWLEPKLPTGEQKKYLGIQGHWLPPAHPPSHADNLENRKKWACFNKCSENTPSVPCFQKIGTSSSVLLYRGALATTQTVLARNIHHVTSTASNTFKLSWPINSTHAAFPQQRRPTSTAASAPSDSDPPVVSYSASQAWSATHFLPNTSPFGLYSGGTLVNNATVLLSR